MLTGAALYRKTLQEYADKNIGNNLIKVLVQSENSLDDDVHALYEIHIDGRVYSNFLSFQEADDTIRILVDGFNLAKRKAV